MTHNTRGYFASCAVLFRALGKGKEKREMSKMFACIKRQTIEYYSTTISFIWLLVFEIIHRPYMSRSHRFVFIISVDLAPLSWERFL